MGKTVSGLTKADLFKNKRGKIVSRKQSFSAKKRFSKTLGPWSSAVTKARKALNLRGFVATTGRPRRAGPCTRRRSPSTRSEQHEWVVLAEKSDESLRLARRASAPWSGAFPLRV